MSKQKGNKVYLFQRINFSIVVASIIAIFIFLNYLAYRHYKQWDVTKSKLYTLSDESIKIVKDLEKEINITVFLPPSFRFFDNIKDMFTRYESLNNDKINIEYFDPDKYRERAQLLVEKYDIDKANVIIFECGEKRKYVYADDIIEYDYSGMRYRQTPKVKAFKGEQEFTSAILAVSETKKNIIGYITGHGENDIDSYDMYEGYSEVKKIIERLNYKIDKLDLPRSETIPDTLDLIVISSPDMKYLDNELKLLDEYFYAGGRALIMIDPILGYDTQLVRSGLDKILKKYGILVENRLLIDPNGQIPGMSGASILLNNYGMHLLGEKMASVPVLFTVATEIHKADSIPVQYKVTEIIKTTDDGWAEVNLFQLNQIEKDEIDYSGPVSAAVVSENKDNGMRLVVVGDGDFCSNIQIKNMGNGQFFKNCINWLANKEKRVAIASKRINNVKLSFSSNEVRNIFFLVIIIMPLASIIIGIVVYIKRRN